MGQTISLLPSLIQKLSPVILLLSYTVSRERGEQKRKLIQNIPWITRFYEIKKRSHFDDLEYFNYKRFSFFANRKLWAQETVGFVLFCFSSVAIIQNFQHLKYWNLLQTLKNFWHFSSSVHNSYMCDMGKGKSIIFMISQMKDICISLCVGCILF